MSQPVITLWSDADFLHQKRLTMHFLAKKLAAFALK